MNVKTKKFDAKALKIFLKDLDKDVEEIRNDENITRVMKELADA